MKTLREDDKGTRGGGDKEKRGKGDKEKGGRGDKGASNPKIETQTGGSYE